MSRTWIFFKLRMLQLKSDKTALFFCYVLPVLLLLCVGYPLQMKGDAGIDVFYTAAGQNASAQALLEDLHKQPLVKLQPYLEAGRPARVALESNDIKHYLEITASGYTLYSTSLRENRVENAALQGILEGYLTREHLPALVTQTVTSPKATSYLATLLPGLIGMTLLIIGLAGFGAALVAERDHGLHKNMKTIDVSPVAFLAGLLASRLAIAYSVAVALFAAGVFVFGLSVHINYLLLGLIVTLGSVTFIALGLLLATLSPSVSAFNGMVNMVQMPLIVLGGVFVSVSTFPGWLRSVANLLPLTEFNAAVRSILFESAGFANMAPLYAPIGALAAWCVLTLALARLRFKW